MSWRASLAVFELRPSFSGTVFQFRYFIPSVWNFPFPFPRFTFLSHKADPSFCFHTSSFLPSTPLSFPAADYFLSTSFRPSILLIRFPTIAVCTCSLTPWSSPEENGFSFSTLLARSNIAQPIFPFSLWFLLIMLLLSSTFCSSPFPCLANEKVPPSFFVQMFPLSSKDKIKVIIKNI